VPILTSSPVTLHFAHANGFPADSYRYLFSILPQSWQIHALPKFGHSQRFPISRNWHNQREELAQSITHDINPQHPIYLVGHSFGAIVSYMTACQLNDKVAGLIMLDPPLVTGFSRMIIRLAKQSSMIDKLTRADLAESRKTQWHHDEDVVDYFKNKALFKHFHEKSLQDYVDANTISHQDGKVLHFDNRVEAAVFRNIPHDLHRYTGQLACPATVITGSHTDICIPRLRNRFIRANNMSHCEVTGGHMFPLEQPVDTAKAIQETIEQWQISR